MAPPAGHRKNPITIQPRSESSRDEGENTLENTSAVVIQEHEKYFFQYDIWDANSGAPVLSGKADADPRAITSSAIPYKLSMKDKNGTELFNVEKNVAFPIFGCCYSNYFLPGYGLCCKYVCLPCFRCEVGDAEMKMNSDNKNYTLKHIPNVSGHPTIDISSTNPSSITGDSFTVVLPSCCMLPYNCNDVIYDVKEKSTGDVKANITRRWTGGGCLECTYGCKPSTWVVEFNSKLTVEQKMAIISSALLAEITFYKMNKKGATRTGCC